MTPAGFPHSDIHGSTPACGSPWLIAANHVLLRLLTPRHPPSALSSLTTNLSASPCGFACGVKTKVRFSRHFQRRRFRDALASTNLAHVNTKKTHVLDSRFVLLFSCQKSRSIVGLVRFELTTPRLSSV